MRPLFLILLLAACAQTAPAAEPSPTPTWPLWDGAETVEQYSKRANLEATKSLDLGDGVKMEMVLIPAGKFVMGTPEPETVDEEGFQKKIVVGQLASAVGGGTLLVLLGVVAIRAILRRRRPQYSLAYLVVMVLVAGVGVLGGLHWHYSARAFSDAKVEYQVALARYKSSFGMEEVAHEVTISKPYYLGKFEVTQEQYPQVMGKKRPQYKGRDLPADYVDWEDADEFCKKASEKTGVTARLPTEAEWELACRAGTRTAYNTGDARDDLENAGWFDENSKGSPHPVGQKAANAWGVYDMHGNVWEWCGDRYEEYRAEAQVDPRGPATGGFHVRRGGNWSVRPVFCRSASRGWLSRDRRPEGVGFRVVVEVAPRTP
jgi:formylglycine-generating enzyme required for sulfatase activity